MRRVRPTVHSMISISTKEMKICARTWPKIAVNTPPLIRRKSLTTCEGNWLRKKPAMRSLS